MPKVLREEAEGNLRALLAERDRACRALRNETLAFLAKPSCSVRSNRRFNLVHQLLHQQIQSRADEIYGVLGRKLVNMAMVQSTVGKTEEDEDLRKLLVTVTHGRVVEETIRYIERGITAMQQLSIRDEEPHQRATRAMPPPHGIEASTAQETIDLSDEGGTVGRNADRSHPWNSEGEAAERCRAEAANGLVEPGAGAGAACERVGAQDRKCFCAHCCINMTLKWHGAVDMSDCSWSFPRDDGFTGQSDEVEPRAWKGRPHLKEICVRASKPAPHPGPPHPWTTPMIRPDMSAGCTENCPGNYPTTSTSERAMIAVSGSPNVCGSPAYREHGRSNSVNVSFRRGLPFNDPARVATEVIPPKTSSTAPPLLNGLPVFGEFPQDRSLPNVRREKERTESAVKSLAKDVESRTNYNAMSSLRKRPRDELTEK